MCVITNLNKHFSNDKELKKLFNRNNVEVSYSCMPNMASIIKGHNSKILAPTNQQKARHAMAGTLALNSRTSP